MEYQKITNLLGATSDNVPRFITKKWIEVRDQSGNAENRHKPKHQCYNRIYVITVMHVLLSKELLLLKQRMIGH